MLFKCVTCSCSKNHDPADNGEALPAGWRIHTLEEKRLLLCSNCGSQMVSHDGMSPNIRKRLKELGYRLEG